MSSYIHTLLPVCTLLPTPPGWIHTLLEEAENERMHLLTFMHIRNPGLLLRASVLLTQVWGGRGGRDGWRGSGGLRM